MNHDKDGEPTGLSSITNSESKNERHDCNETESVPKKQFERNHGRNGYNDSRAFFLITLMMLFATSQAQSNMCVHRKDYKPPACVLGQDIVVEHGLSIQVHCSGLDWSLMNPLYRSCEVSDLEILVDNKSVQRENLTVTNENTLTLSLTTPPPSKFTFGCRRRLNSTDGEEYIERNVQVFVGFKPRKPRSVKCLSHNFEGIVCTWEPVPNDVETQFSLRFEFPEAVGVNSSFTCSPPRVEDNLPQNSCILPISDMPENDYSRLIAENYTIALDAENVLGTEYFTYNFHHWANVIPSYPVNLSVVSTTPSSALLHWSVPYRFREFPPGLHYRVTYQKPWAQRSNWHFQTIDIKDHTHDTEIFFNLTNLENANTIYYVRVYIKSALATDEDMWGRFSDVVFKTSMTLPCLPPKIDIGSFEVVVNSYNRDVYVYWQTSPTYLENADDFPYEIIRVDENGDKLHLHPQEVTKTYAKFTGLSFNSFEFEISGTNCEGTDNPTATVRVPSHLEMPPKPVPYTKIAHDDGVYELSWHLPSNSGIMCYNTIFWCASDRDRPYQCSGYLDWVHVPGDASSYNVTVPDPDQVYQFAISSNTAQASTGMVWFSGMTTFNSVYAKVKSVRVNHIEIDMVVVEWDWDCSDRINIVKGINLYYCPVQSPFNLECKGTKMKTTVQAVPQKTQTVIRDLNPFTTYMITVAVVSEHTQDGLGTDPVFFTTLESAPSPPQAVVVTSMTKTTASVEWQPPAAMNGILRYYIVYYNWQPMKKVERATRLVLSDIETENGFCVSVAACTVWCTKSSATCIEPRNHTLALPWKR